MRSGVLPAPLGGQALPAELWALVRSLRGRHTVGRAWVEALRVEQPNPSLGLRLNDWTSLAVFLAAVAYLILARGGTPPSHVDTADTAPAEEDSADRQRSVSG